MKLKPTDNNESAIKAYLAEIGSKGGKVKSLAKSRAARENGKKHKPLPDSEVTANALYQRDYRAAKKNLQKSERNT